MATVDLPAARVLIVSRRSLRKNKFVDFVGEYHLDLIVGYGAVPVIVPRVSGIDALLESFEPIHGVLLCEGEDIDPSLYDCSDGPPLSAEEVAEIRRLHASDTAVDREKDSIEFRLAKLCLERNIPYLGICRGSQVLNVACGGTLYQDIGKEVSINLPTPQQVAHMDYDNYDGHRHPIRVVDATPLHSWFKDSFDSSNHEIMVNSYHHQGVKRLARRFVPMAFAPDGLVEGFYDPNAYNPDEGKFVVGLQFHPERMRKLDSDEFDYPGCAYAYKDFVRAVIACQKKQETIKAIPTLLKLNVEIENKKRVVVRSFSLAKDIYLAGGRKSAMLSSHDTDHKVGSELMDSNLLSSQQEGRLKEMGATVRNSFSYLEKIKANEEREKAARKILDQMAVDRLAELMSFYHMMGKICGEIVEKKLHGQHKVVEG